MVKNKAVANEMHYTRLTSRSWKRCFKSLTETCQIDRVSNSNDRIKVVVLRPQVLANQAVVNKSFTTEFLTCSLYSNKRRKCVERRDKEYQKFRVSMISLNGLVNQGIW